MSVDESLITLNKKFLCYSAETDAGQPLARFDGKEFHDGVKLDVTTSIARKQYSGFSILNNPQFAIFNYLNLVAQYYAGDFLPVTENKYFLKQIKKIWPSLISKWYFGEVWIAHDAALRIAEQKAIESKGDDWYKKDYFPDSNIRLYVRQKDPDTGRHSFKSVWTNVTIPETAFLHPEQLVQASCNGIYNFMGWWKILLDYISGEEAYINAFHASLKTIAVDVQDEAKFNYESGELQGSKDVFFIRNNAGVAGASTHNENEWEEFTCFPIEGVLQVLKNNRALFDERAAFYGMFGKNLDQKKERNTVGENWVDFKYVNNIQKQYLMNLEVMAMDMIDKLRFPNDFRIVLNTNEPHEDERFKQMQGWKGGNKFDKFAGNNFQGNNVERDGIEGG